MTHLWFALSHAEQYHLKKLVLRAYLDNEDSPSEEHICSRYTVYRFHTEEPIPFHRSATYYATAYWYRKEPHAPMPAMIPMSERVPEVRVIGGPGALTPQS